MTSVTTISQSRCTICPAPPKGGNKPVPTHIYGDYIILKPSAESCKKLEKLGGIYGKVLSDTVKGIDKHIEFSKKADFHLTLAMPLKPMKRGDVNKIVNKIGKLGITGPQKFDLIFRNPKNEGSYGCSFGSPNYSPTFDIRLAKPQKKYHDHTCAESVEQMGKISKRIQRYCEKKDLVDKSRNKDGLCNSFKPHITLGRVKDDTFCKLLHDRNNHSNNKSLSYLVSNKASESFTCSKKHKSCPTLTLEFDTIEILRCDANRGKDHKVTSLASIDLQSKKVTTAKKFPGCTHG